MKLFFLTEAHSALTDSHSPYFTRTRNALLRQPGVVQVNEPESADAIILKEKWSYKDFRYLKRLHEDSVTCRFPEKVYTVNDDDAGAGFLQGLYTNLSSRVYEPDWHVPVPYLEYFNEIVYSEQGRAMEPVYLAGWRGNLISSPVRKNLIRLFANQPDFLLETSDKWLNHGEEEKRRYVETILNCRFTLCPSGWGPSSFRIYESMALGRCPVIIADRFVPPAGPDWDSFAIRVPEKQIRHLESILQERRDEWKVLGELAAQSWKQYFSHDKLEQIYADSMLELIRKNSGRKREDILNRWNSRDFHKANGWRLLQRGRNRIRKLGGRLGFG